MIRIALSSRLIVLSALFITVGLLLPLQAAGPIPAKLSALFPKGASETWSSEPAKLGFMTSVTCTATLPKTSGCLFHERTPHALFFEIKAYDVQSEMGAMQAEMIPLTTADQLAVMRKQLEERRAYWKGRNFTNITTVREEKVGKGTILMISCDGPCHDVNPDRPSYHEVRLRAYFFNGRSEVTVKLENFCTDAEARVIIVQLFEKIDRTDFKDMM